MLNDAALKVGELALTAAKYSFMTPEPGVLLEAATMANGGTMPPMFWMVQGLRFFAPNALSTFASVKSEAMPYLKEVANISVDDLYMDWTTQRMRWQIGREMKRRQLRKRGKRAKNKEEREEAEALEKL